MRGSSTNLRVNECREVLFWLLLPGSWQFLASQGSRAAGVGVVRWHLRVPNLRVLLSASTHDQGPGRSSDPCLPMRKAGKLPRRRLAGMAVFVIGILSGQSMRLGDNWRLIVLQVTLGPVLEEVVFRGYLFSLLMWLLGRVAVCARFRLTVVSAAVIFAVVHLSQPGVSWLQLACITSTGMLYGWMRWRSGSTALAAVSHALYNLAFYAISGAMLLGEKVLTPR